MYIFAYKGYNIHTFAKCGSKTISFLVTRDVGHNHSLSGSCDFYGIHGIHKCAIYSTPRSQAGWKNVALIRYPHERIYSYIKMYAGSEFEKMLDKFISGDFPDKINLNHHSEKACSLNITDCKWYHTDKMNQAWMELYNEDISMLQYHTTDKEKSYDPEVVQIIKNRFKDEYDFLDRVLND